MLYLEDYQEMIEHLPQELRDRDLAVQNNMDSLDKKAHLFFKHCKRDELQHESMDTEFHSLRGEYFKVMENADEKVAIATQMHELVERYLRLVNSSADHMAAATGAGTGSTVMPPTNAGALTSISAVELSASQRHRKLEKRRETICTVPVQEKRANLNHSLPVVASGSAAVPGSTAASATATAGLTSVTTAQAQASNHIGCIVATHLILPVAVGVSVGTAGSLASTSSLTEAAGSVVRQLPTNLAHSVLTTSGGGATQAQGHTVETTAPIAAAAATGHGHAGQPTAGGSATVTYNLQQLGGGVFASGAIAWQPAKR